MMAVLSYRLRSQDNFIGYWQPQVSLEYKVTPLYSHNNSIEERHFYYKDNSSFWQVQQLDLSHFSQYKFLDNQTVALGIQYRFRENFIEDEQNELRFTQQFNKTVRGFVVRHGHRFRAEQRIKSDATTHRFRYRYALDFPIAGQTLDVNEFFIAVATESLFSMASESKPEWDQRLMINMGTAFNSLITVEFGLEYRLENYSRELQHILIVNSGLNFSL